MKLKILLSFTLMFVLTACNLRTSGNPVQIIDSPVGGEPVANMIDQNSSREPEARSAVMDFYNALNQGAYPQAESLYGGPYDDLQYFNPDLDPMDNISLLQAGCEFNGIMCLQVLTVALMQKDDPLEFVYEVSFSNPDGSLFVLGPCCGASEEDMPPVSVFTVSVNCKSDHACLVLDLPPFVP